MKRTDTVVIGGGQAGLAMSRVLADRGIEHVVLERGRVAERWRSERWESLRLITPNWMTRLPGWRYGGPDPDGFMPAADVARYLAAYAQSFDAPVVTEAAVTAVERLGGGYRVASTAGAWWGRTVVLATGCFDIPHVPEWGAALPAGLHQIAPSRYRNPALLPEGGALVVGASASGVQIAEEIHRSGRPVTLAVGRHTRLPRRYRGLDIMWWLERLGLLDARIEDVPDPVAVLRQPSLQLVGDRSIGLADLAAQGVRLVGRAIGTDGAGVHFAGDLAASIAAADAKLARLLARCDAWADGHGYTCYLNPPEMPATLAAGDSPARLDLAADGIATVVWATGFRRRYPWLQVGVLDGDGEIVHRGGVTPAPGLYAMGLRFMRRRKSTFIDGAGPDAEEIGAHIHDHLAASRRLAA